MEESLSILVLNVMEIIEVKYEHLKGQDKKDKVLFMVKVIIVDRYGEDVWYEVEKVLPDLIEFIIQISKNKLIIKVNEQVQKKCLDLFKGRGCC